MKISLQRTDSAFSMQASNQEGGIVEMDASPEIGGGGTKMRPMQLLLAALGGCSTIDVLHILRKQRVELESLSLDIEGEREQVGECKLFRQIHLHFYAKGQEAQKDKVQRAIELSLEKYCSVAKTLESGAEIRYTLHWSP